MKVQVSTILDEKGDVKAWQVKKIYPWGTLVVLTKDLGAVNDGEYDHQVNDAWANLTSFPTKGALRGFLEAYRRWRRYIQNKRGIKILKAPLDLEEKIIQKLKRKPFKKIIIGEGEEKNVFDSCEDALMELQEEIETDKELKQIYKVRRIVRRNP